MQTNRHMNRHQLILCSDQHAPNISGFAGDTLVRTPNLDRLASMGTVYENHYCNNPVCTPGRYSMLTGLLPRENKTLFFLNLFCLQMRIHICIILQNMGT